MLLLSNAYPLRTAEGPFLVLPKLALRDKLGAFYLASCQESMPANFSPLCKYNRPWYALAFHIDKGPTGAGELSALTEYRLNFVGP